MGLICWSFSECKLLMHNMYNSNHVIAFRLRLRYLFEFLILCFFFLLLDSQWMFAKVHSLGFWHGKRDSDYSTTNSLCSGEGSRSLQKPDGCCKWETERDYTSHRSNSTRYEGGTCRHCSSLPVPWYVFCV